MKRVLALTMLLSIAGSSQAMAANLGVITSPPTLLNVVVFGMVIGCAVGSFKILSLLKGGFLFKSWQIFLCSFIVLALSEVGILLSDFQVVALPKFAVPALLILAVGLFLFGIFETKKVLD